MPLLVYGLSDCSRSRRRLRGIEGEPLRFVTVGRITAVIGSVQAAPVATTESLRHYDAVVRTLASSTTALLPARFATLMTGLTEIEQVLIGRQQYLMGALRHVRGRAQMTVRVIDMAGSGADNTLPKTVDAPPRDGASYLRARAAEAARARHVPGFDPVRKAVDRFIRDERVDTRGAVATVYHLIPRASAASYRRALEAAARDAGLRVIVSGPWPPYAFTEA